MNNSIIRARFAALLAGVILAGCGPVVETPVDRLPAPRDVLMSVGKRLAQSYSAQEITNLTQSTDAILSKLTSAERSALGQSAIRFQVDQPAVIEIAALEGSAPFWLAEQGFRDTHKRLEHPRGKFRLHQKSVTTGWVALGVNSLDAHSSAHYAVFVRPEKQSTAPLRIAELDENAARVVPANGEHGPWFDSRERFQAIPRELAGGWLLQTRDSSRNSTVLLKGRAWKTHVPSGSRPDHVAIEFGADPARSLTFTWRTEPSQTNSYVRFAPAEFGQSRPADTNAIRVVSGSSEPVESDGLVNDPVIRRHRVHAVGLKPNTTYVYSLGDGSPTGWTPWRTTRTGPDSPRDFSFLYMGDPQCGLEEWGKLLRAAHRRNPGSAFLLIAGDLVDRGNERTNWDHFFLRAAGVFDELPLMPAIGNHEYLDEGPRLYRAFFQPPRNGPSEMSPGLVYSFEYGDAVFAILDSNPEATRGDGARIQAAWLDSVLSHSRATWKFVVFHHPMYTSHLTRKTPEDLRATWIPVFDKHQVDMVLQGHDHAYMRTHRMHADRVAQPDNPGTYYVVSVSGTKYCEQAPRDYIARGEVNVSTYQTIQIQHQERRLIYRSVDINGQEIDYLVIQKPAGKDSSEDYRNAPEPVRLATDPRAADGSTRKK
jgi:hypothetical protein